MSKEAAEAAGTTSGPSALLLQEYNAEPEEKRTARTPVVRDALMTEAMNIIALNQTSSVLTVRLRMEMPVITIIIIIIIVIIIIIMHI